MRKNSKIAIIIAFFVLLMLVLIFVKFEREHNQEKQFETKTASLFKNIDKSNFAKVTKYIVYGTHFNIEGKIEIPKISGISVDSANIIVKNITEDEIVLHSSHSYKDGILTFSSIEYINDGLCLDNLPNDNFYLFLRVIFSNSEVKYYSLENNSEYGDMTYYSLTHENSNNKIEISFDKYKDFYCMKISSIKVDSLPENVYDIVVDASHGGSDTGCKTKNFTEANLVLKCAKELKQNLENYGFKVFLTRDGSEPEDADMSTNMYDENGRINTAQESYSKLLISLNINDKKSKKGGVEVYAPTMCNLDFAELIADNIVKIAKTSYSSTKSYKQSDRSLCA